MLNLELENNFLSIIIPFYCTKEELYKRCLDSILENKLENIDVVVINDGSPDEYLSILQYRLNDKRLRILTQEHYGPSKARNLGIKEAIGSKIMFVDSDDFLNTEVFSEIINNLENFIGDVDIFHGGKYQNGKSYPNSIFLQENHNYSENNQDKIFIMESALSIGNYPEEQTQYFSLGSPCCKLFQKKFLLENNLKFDETVKFGEDVLFMLNVYLHSNKIFFHNLYLYNYVYNFTSVTKKYRPGLSKDMDLFFKKIENFLQDNHLIGALQNAYYARAEYEVGHCFRSEFFHHLNKEPGAQTRFENFCDREPYSSALKFSYLPKKRMKLKMLYLVINLKIGFLYKYFSSFYCSFYN